MGFPSSLSRETRLAAAACFLVAAVYTFLGFMGVTSRDCPDASEQAYNTLARGFMSGHLYAQKPVPAGLAALPDPYDPVQSERFRASPELRLHDFSYYGGHLYLYFGPVPALVAFAPWHLLTGSWLPHWVVVVAACLLGLLVNLSLVLAVKRSLYPAAPDWVGAACVLALGLASYGPLLAARADMWEVPIAFGYLFVSLGLRLLWSFRADPARRLRWLALASAAYGLAFASRPATLPAAVALVAAVALCGAAGSWRAWAAAVAPAAGCGCLVALYNWLRFDNPFEFGMRYQLANEYMARMRTFSVTYAPENLRLYLFEPVRWLGVFPFVREPLAESVRSGLSEAHGGTEHLAGILLCSPILWAVFAIPWVGGRRLLGAAATAAWTAVGMLALLCCFFGACSRYQFEFAAWFALVAALAIVAAEGAGPGPARIWVRAAWAAALSVSCAFTVLYAVDRCVEDRNAVGFEALLRRDAAEAERCFTQAQILSPGNPSSRLGLAWLLEGEGRAREAEAAYRDLIARFPGERPARVGLANLLRREGRLEEAEAERRAAGRADPSTGPGQGNP